VVRSAPTNDGHRGSSRGGHGARRAHRHGRGRPWQESGAPHRRVAARHALRRNTGGRLRVSTPGTTRTRPARCSRSSSSPAGSRRSKRWSAGSTSPTRSSRRGAASPAGTASPATTATACAPTTPYADRRPGRAIRVRPRCKGWDLCSGALRCDRDGPRDGLSLRARLTAAQTVDEVGYGSRRCSSRCAPSSDLVDGIALRTKDGGRVPSSVAPHSCIVTRPRRGVRWHRDPYPVTVVLRAASCDRVSRRRRAPAVESRRAGGLGRRPTECAAA
jgi:hypothetical protein